MTKDTAQLSLAERGLQSYLEGQSVNLEHQEKIRVGIIMGGISSEREISLESGRNIFSKIDRKKYLPISIFMDSSGFLWEIPVKMLMRNSTGDIECDLEDEAKRIPYEELKTLVDIVYLGLQANTAKTVVSRDFWSF